MSVYRILRELFSALSDPSLPTPTSTLPFVSLDDFLSNIPSPAISFVPPSNTWELLPTISAILDHLPRASEEAYPVLPLPPSPLPPPPPPSSALATSPRLARQRWFWAISRSLLVVSNRLHPRSPQLARMEPHPPVQAKTRWPAFSFSKEDTIRLVAFSKSNGLSPSKSRASTGKLR